MFEVIAVKPAFRSLGQPSFFQVTTGGVREKFSSDCMKWDVFGMCKDVGGLCCFPVRQAGGLGEKEEEGRMSSFALRSSWKIDPQVFYSFSLCSRQH